MANSAEALQEALKDGRVGGIVSSAIDRGRDKLIGGAWRGFADILESDFGRWSKYAAITIVAACALVIGVNAAAGAVNWAMHSGVSGNFASAGAATLFDGLKAGAEQGTWLLGQPIGLTIMSVAGAVGAGIGIKREYDALATAKTDAAERTEKQRAQSAGKEKERISDITNDPMYDREIDSPAVIKFAEEVLARRAAQQNGPQGGMHV